MSNALTAGSPPGATIFLSYRRADAADLASRLREDLQVHGYTVSLDRTDIRAGCFWDEEIDAGLRGSRVLVALLSPHSVRRTGDVTTPSVTDSVCLDEIHTARSRNIP